VGKTLGMIYVSEEFKDIVSEYDELKPLITDEFGENVCFVICDQESYVREDGVMFLDHTRLDVFAECVFNFFMLSKAGIPKDKLLKGFVEILTLNGKEVV